jgi:hypothetical protein
MKSQEIFGFLKQRIALSILVFSITGCVAPGLGLYQKALADRQAAYQQALNQRGANQRSIFSNTRGMQVTQTASLSPEQQEQERQKAEMQRLAELQRQSKEGAKEIPIGLAEKLLVGTLKGSACNKKNSVEINLAGPQSRERHLLKVGGTLRTLVQAEQPNTPVIEAALEGRFNINTGIFYLWTAPSPPAREKVIEEQQRRQQAMEEFKVRDRERQMQYMKLLQESRGMTSEERTRASQEYHTKEKLLQDEYYMLLKRNNQPLAQPIPPAISLKMDISRDADGKGWVGVIERGFNDCHQIVLASEEGSTTSELPPITGEVAFNTARPRGLAWPGIISQMYWLDIAAKQGNTDAQFALGQIYEAQGQQTPQDYQYAFQYYRAAADKGNAPAQSALSRMYAKGWGAPRDPKESQRWGKLAESQYNRASKVCVAPKMVKEIDQLMKEQREDPALKRGQAFALIFAQTAVSLGTHQITDITLEKFSSIDFPFRCTVTAKRIGMSMTNFTPSFEYAGTDEYGNRQYRDQRLDKLAKEKFTDMANELAKQDFTQSFDVEPQGNQLYKLILVRGMHDSREYSKVVDLR